MRINLTPNLQNVSQARIRLFVVRSNPLTAFIRLLTVLGGLLEATVCL